MGLTLNKPGLPQETTDMLAKTITGLLAQDLREIARITVLNIDLQPEQSWYVGAAPVSGVGGHLGVLLSDHINTDQGKGAVHRSRRHPRHRKDRRPAARRRGRQPLLTTNSHP